MTAVERAMVDSGIQLVKYWLEVSAEEQTRRLGSYSRWYDYSRARDEMFAETVTAWAPWWVASPLRAAREAGRHAPEASEGRRLS